MPTMMLVLTVFAAQPTIEELKQMPQVASVEARAVANPSHRITHILNWHFVTRDDFELEADAQDYEAFLKDVDAVQVEQMEFLQQLKVRKVFYEGLTTKNYADYVERAAMLKTLGKQWVRVGSISCWRTSFGRTHCNWGRPVPKVPHSRMISQTDQRD